MDYEPYDMATHEGPCRRDARLSVAERREADPEAFTYPFPVLEREEDVDDLVDWAVRRLYAETCAGERVVDWDDFFDHLEDYAEVAITRNSGATRRIREIVREERRAK